MPAGPFVSYAQNAEDVVLWRALRDVPNGRYVDVGASHPELHSVTKAFYDRGWTGLNVEPVADYVEFLERQRPRDIVVRAAVTESDDGSVTLHEFPDTGLSTVRDEYVLGHVTHGYDVRDVEVPTRRLEALVREHLAGEPVHFCKIDVEGAEAEVIRSADLGSWRPWILVIEATRPTTNQPTHEDWEHLVLGAGYQFCLFDGLNRFYVSDEHADLAPRLSYPACVLDDYQPAHQLELANRLESLQQVHHETVEENGQLRAQLEPLRDEVRTLRAELVRWRGVVLERWANAVAPQDEAARQELEAMRRTLSWRVTKPLRAVRSLQLRATP